MFFFCLFVLFLLLLLLSPDLTAQSDMEQITISWSTLFYLLLLPLTLRSRQVDWAARALRSLYHRPGDTCSEPGSSCRSALLSTSINSDQTFLLSLATFKDIKEIYIWAPQREIYIPSKYLPNLFLLSSLRTWTCAGRKCFEFQVPSAKRPDLSPRPELIGECLVRASPVGTRYCTRTCEPKTHAHTPVVGLEKLNQRLPLVLSTTYCIGETWPHSIFQWSTFHVQQPHLSSAALSCSCWLCA